MKILRIVSCIGDCPFFDGLDRKGKAYCGRCDPPRELGFLDEIPDWCPLENNPD